MTQIICYMIALFQAAFQSIKHEAKVLAPYLLALTLATFPNFAYLILCPGFTLRVAPFFWGLWVLLLPCIFCPGQARRFVRWYLPFAVLAPIPTMYVLTTLNPANRYAYLIALESNKEEMTLFLGRTLIALASMPVVCWIYLKVVRLLPPTLDLNRLSKLAMICGVLALPFYSAARSGVAFSYNSHQHDFLAAWPLGSLIEIRNATAFRREVAREVADTDNMPIEVTREASSDSKAQREIHVLIIGESARASAFQLNGATRPTNPSLSKIHNLVNFTDVAAQATVTCMSVPLILTGKEGDGFSSCYQSPTLITVFKRGGFHTSCFSNQGKYGMYSTDIAKVWCTADNSDFAGGKVLKSAYNRNRSLDTDLITFLDQTISRPESSQMIILHCMGSHWDYQFRYPPEFATFPTAGLRTNLDSPVFATGHELDLINNAYDNSILFTDHFVAAAIERLNKEDAVSTLWFLSDHGENEAHTAVMLGRHGVVTEDVVHIPMMVWYSDKYAAAHPDRVTRLRNRSNLPVSSQNIFHSLLEIAELKTPLVKPHLSLVNEEFREVRRSVLQIDGVSLVDFDTEVRRKSPSESSTAHIR